MPGTDRRVRVPDTSLSAARTGTIRCPSAADSSWRNVSEAGSKE